MQPLFVAVFGPLKEFFEQELNFFLKKYAGRIVNQYDVCKIFSPAYMKAATIRNAVKGFKKPGLWPFNPSVFTDDDFVPASVTSRPDENEHVAMDMPRSTAAASSQAASNTPMLPTSAEEPACVADEEPACIDDKEQAPVPGEPGPSTSPDRSCEVLDNLPVPSAALSPMTNYSSHSGPSGIASSSVSPFVSPFQIRPVTSCEGTTEKERNAKNLKF